MNDDNKQIELEIISDDQAASKEADEPEVEIQLEGEAPVEAPVSAAPVEKEEDDVQKTIKTLKEKIEREQQARQEAEERARIASQKLNAAYNEVEDSNINLITSAIETVKRENEYLKNEYRNALALSDFDKVADLQEAMSSNAAKLLQLENGKQSMQNKPRQQAPDYSNPVEQFASQLSPRSAEWVRRHPQCVTDQRLQQKMIAAHNLAVADGYQPDSDDYFGFIEDTLKVGNRYARQEEKVQEESALSSASKPVSRQAPPPAAPANRGSTRSNVVRLTKAEADTAKMFGMTEQEYAKNKVALQKEGKMPN
jgi:hypothetical protein